METKLIKRGQRATVNTMSGACFRQIDQYITSNAVLSGDRDEILIKIKNLDHFRSGCFTYIQADVFTDYYYYMLLTGMM